MNPANKATLLRVVLVPFLIVSFYLKTDAAKYISFGIYLLASATDIWDGWYARKHNTVTDFGKLMDPMADKLLNCTVFVFLCARGTLDPLITVIFIGRELIISAFRLVAAEKGTVIAAGRLGKLKTLLQFIAICLLLLENPFFNRIGFPMDWAVTYAAAFFTVVSCVEYIVKNRDIIKDC